MYSVMLVDDDIPVLDYLSSMIPWDELGLKLHSACKNGAVALDEAKRLPPDIVVTDIGMPQMDGIALIEELKRLKSDTRIVILSCMDDFKYAQKAVRLQVDDYVLKETMSKELISELLSRLAEELQRAERMSEQIDSWRGANEENSITLRQNLLHRIAAGAHTRDTAWLPQAERFGLEFDGRGYLPVLCFLNRTAEIRERFPQDHAIMLAVDAGAKEALREQAGALLLPGGVRDYIVLIPCRRTLKENVYDSLQNVIRELLLQLKREYGISTSYLYGSVAADPAGLAAETERLLSAAQQRFYLAEDGILALSALPGFAGNDLYALYPTALGEMRDAFLEEDEAGLSVIIDKWMAWIKERRYPPATVKEWVLKIVYDVQSRLLAQQHYQSTFSLEVLHRTIAEIDTIDEMSGWVRNFFQERLPLVQLIYSQSRRSEILEAQQYVTKHIGKKITLEEVAELLHINSSYFSRLFKKETGHNFINYVTYAKMERARELLETTPISVEKIAEKLGYDNKSYFTKLFKKHTGSTPGDYRGM